MVKTRDQMDDTKRLMGALVRMKPKPHEEMKVGEKRPVERQKKTVRAKRLPEK